MITPIRIAIAAAVAQAARNLLRNHTQASKPRSAWQRMQDDQQRKLYRRYEDLHNRRRWFR